jgi:hypothetical protein
MTHPCPTAMLCTLCCSHTRALVLCGFSCAWRKEKLWRLACRAACLGPAGGCHRDRGRPWGAMQAMPGPALSAP